MKRLIATLGLLATLDGCMTERTLSVTTEPAGATVSYVNTTPPHHGGNVFLEGRVDEIIPLGVSPIASYVYGKDVSDATTIVSGIVLAPVIAPVAGIMALQGDFKNVRAYPQLTLLAEKEGYYPARVRKSIPDQTPAHLDFSLPLTRIESFSFDIIAPPGTRIAVEKPVMQYDAKAGRAIPTGVGYQHEGIEHVHFDNYVDVFPGVQEDRLLGIELRKGSKYRKTYIHLGQKEYHLDFPED